MFLAGSWYASYEEDVTAAEMIPIDLIDVQDWWSSIIWSLKQPSLTVVAKGFKDFIIINGELHHGDNGGLLDVSMIFLVERMISAFIS